MVERSERLTAKQAAALHEELATLEGPRRAEVVAAIKKAREFGDLSENFEYHAAKNEQGLLEARIRTLHSRDDDGRDQRGRRSRDGFSDLAARRRPARAHDRRHGRRSGSAWCLARDDPSHSLAADSRAEGRSPGPTARLDTWLPLRSSAISAA